MEILPSTLTTLQVPLLRRMGTTLASEGNYELIALSGPFQRSNNEAKLCGPKSWVGMRNTWPGELSSIDPSQDLI